MPRATVLPSGVRYSGLLAKPILAPAGDNGEDDGLVAAERDFRLCLLLEAYGIKEGDPNAWQRLAMQLATDHVPGMQVITSRNTPGRKAQWPVGLGQTLIEAVAHQKKANGIGTKAAIVNLSRDKNGPFYRMHVDCLIARHTEARRSLEPRSDSAKMPSGILSFIDLVVGPRGATSKAALKRRFGSISLGAVKRWFAKKYPE